MAKKKAAVKPARMATAPGTGLIAGVAEHPRLLAVAAGTIGAGVVTRRGDLVRGGARMLAAQLIATAMRNAVAAKLDRSSGREGEGVRPGGDHHLTDAVVGGVAGWIAEAVVAAVFDRVEPAIERAVAARLAA